GIPLSGSMMSMGYSIPDQAAPSSDTHGQSEASSSSTSHPITWMVGSHFFSTMGIPIRAGRDFSDADRGGAMKVAIVDESFARREWPGGNALGKCIELGNRKAPQCYTVVGIAANANLVSLETQRFPEYFIPLAQYPGSLARYQAFLIRTSGNPSRMMSAIRNALDEMEPNLPYVELRTMADILRPELQPRRLGASLFAVFGVLALVLAGIGLYGVIAFAVAQRTHEMGIRLALGARPRDVVSLVVRQSVLLTLAGLVIGIAGALAAAKLVTDLLFGVKPVDPVTLAGVVLLLAAATTLASWLPARRATRVDPMVALRSE
ncbi:MAG TPA: FtsX-like permease family protein, partial [Gemmatimonadaceae bacterium]|nr:FtsX-like permease family protein [Gemmatimonadaceae bacterium]